MKSPVRAISAVKLYKHDMAHQRVPTTAGAKTSHGKPKEGCSGSKCYRHKNLDWTVHRFAPAVMKKGGTLDRLGGKHPTDDLSRNGLLSMSPRWGPGVANRTRKQVPLPRKKDIEISHPGTKGAVVGAAAGTAAERKHQSNRKSAHKGIDNKKQQYWNKKKGTK